MSEDTLPIHQIWVYLSGSPLLALVMTLGAYVLGVALYERTNKFPLTNPVLVALITLSTTLYLAEMPYEQYFKGAQFVHFLLGPATVALAIPIFRAWSSLRSRLPVLLVGLGVGGTTSVIVGVGVLKCFGADEVLQRSMWAKSLTAPIAMGVGAQIGASPSLTAVFAVLTGVMGAVFATGMLNLLRIKPWWQRGFAVGVAAHGIGTSRAFSVHPMAGVYASVGMGLHGVLGAVLIPIVYRLF